VVERETSTLITSAFQAVVQPDGCLLVSARSTTLSPDPSPVNGGGEV